MSTRYLDSVKFAQLVARHTRQLTRNAWGDPMLAPGARGVPAAMLPAALRHVEVDQLVKELNDFFHGAPGELVREPGTAEVTWGELSPESREAIDPEHHFDIGGESGGA